MTRGRYPIQTLSRALEIAQKRGDVQEYRHAPGMICSFTIFIAGCMAQVRIKRVRHLRCSVQWLEREAAAELAALRTIVVCDGISRELWIAAPNSRFRYFWICETGLTELDADGRPIPVKSLALAPVKPGAGKVPVTRGQPEGVSENFGNEKLSITFVQTTQVPEKSGKTKRPAVAGLPVPVPEKSGDEKNPVIAGQPVSDPATSSPPPRPDPVT
jgi:hypothetical protein